MEVHLKLNAGHSNRTPKNVLLTRLSAIGDCILTIPVAVQVKRLWPNCKLTWIVDCAAEQLLQEHSCVDEIIRIEKRWMKRPSLWKALRSELQSRNFDVALDPQGLTKSAALGWLSGAKTRIGFDFSHGRELAPMLATRRVTRKARHMVDSYLQVLSPWQTLPAGTGEFAMPVYEEAAERSNAILRELNWVQPNGQSDRWIAINPGAGWTTRRWPVERFGKLAAEMKSRHGLNSMVFWAGQDELLMANVIAEESHGAAIVAPATNLCDMFEFVRRANLLVTSDTGPLHMASALGTPAVSLHGPTWADESGPYNNRHIAIQSPTPHLSKKLNRRGPNLAMQAIELEEVVRACDRMLKVNAAQTRLVA